MKIKAVNTILYCRKRQETVAFYKDGIKLLVLSPNDWFVEFKLNEITRLSIADESHTSVKSGDGLDAHPLELLNEKITGAISTIDAMERIGQRVTVAGVRQRSRRSRTSKGEMMMCLTLEDLDGTLDVILFPDVYRKVKPFVNSTMPMLITGVMEKENEHEEPFLRAEKAMLIR